MTIFPTILVLNGLLQYQPAISPLLPTPLTLLIHDLREDGFRVVEDTHFVTLHSNEEPVIVVGHSQGGGAALRYAERMKREAKFNPLVITFDAAPNYRCPTRCINFMSRQYPPVPGASNINSNSKCSRGMNRMRIATPRSRASDRV